MVTFGAMELAFMHLPGETTANGLGNPWKCNSCLDAKGLDMKERDAPVSKRTFAGISLTRRLPIITRYPRDPNFFLCLILNFKHDSVIFHLLDALGYKLTETFKFGVTLMFEASKMSDNNMEVEVYMINNVGDSLKEINPEKLKLSKICPIESEECRITLYKLRSAYKFLLIRDYQEWLDLCSGKIPL